MRTNWVIHGIGMIAGICIAASGARAQEPKLEPGTKVVARSPDFVLRDGAKVIPVKSPFDTYRVERIAGDRVRLYSSGREGDALASEVVRLDQAEAYFERADQSTSAGGLRLPDAVDGSSLPSRS